MWDNNRIDIQALDPASLRFVCFQLTRTAILHFNDKKAHLNHAFDSRNNKRAANPIVAGVGEMIASSLPNQELSCVFPMVF